MSETLAMGLLFPELSREEKKCESANKSDFKHDRIINCSGTTKALTVWPSQTTD